MNACDISNVNNYSVDVIIDDDIYKSIDTYYIPSQEVSIDNDIYKSVDFQYNPPYVTRQNGQEQLTCNY